MTDSYCDQKQATRQKNSFHKIQIYNVFNILYKNQFCRNSEIYTNKDTYFNLENGSNTVHILDICGTGGE